MNLNRLTTIASWFAISYPVVCFLPIVFILLMASELSLSIGLLGISIGMVALGLGGLASASSNRVRDKHYNNLTEKLESIARRQEELIALVQAQSQHSTTADPGPESPTNGAESAHQPHSH